MVTENQHRSGTCSRPFLIVGKLVPISLPGTGTVTSLLINSFVNLVYYVTPLRYLFMLCSGRFRSLVGLNTVETEVALRH